MTSVYLMIIKCHAHVVPGPEIPWEGRTYGSPMMAFSGRGLRAVKGRSGGD